MCCCTEKLENLLLFFAPIITSESRKCWKRACSFYRPKQNAGDFFFNMSSFFLNSELACGRCDHEQRPFLHPDTCVMKLRLGIVMTSRRSPVQKKSAHDGFIF